MDAYFNATLFSHFGFININRSFTFECGFKIRFHMSVSSGTHISLSFSHPLTGIRVNLDCMRSSVSFLGRACKKLRFVPSGDNVSSSEPANWFFFMCGHWGEIPIQLLADILCSHSNWAGTELMLPEGKLPAFLLTYVHGPPPSSLSCKG